jgi:endonuclease YncB( thermonuclease family)
VRSDELGELQVSLEQALEAMQRAVEGAVRRRRLIGMPPAARPGAAYSQGPESIGAPHQVPDQYVFSWLRLLLLISLFFLTGAASSGELSGRVVGITDGDTLTVLDSEFAQHKIRLAGIDAPEKGQAFGQSAKAALSALAFHRSVRVEWSKADRYNRLIGKVLVSGEDVNLQMISIGMAWHFKKYVNEQAPADRQRYAEAEVKARQMKRGLWSTADPIAPWDYRSFQRSRPSELPANMRLPVVMVSVAPPFVKGKGNTIGSIDSARREAADSPL